LMFCCRRVWAVEAMEVGTYEVENLPVFQVMQFSAVRENSSSERLPRTLQMYSSKEKCSFVKRWQSWREFVPPSTGPGSLTRSSSPAGVVFGPALDLGASIETSPPQLYHHTAKHPKLYDNPTDTLPRTLHQHKHEPQSWSSQPACSARVGTSMSS